MREERTRHLARLLAASEQARGQGTEALAEADAMLPADAVPQQPEDILQEMRAGLSKPPDVGSSDWNKATDLLFAYASSALGKLKEGLALDKDEGCVMEAVILSDGTRPSFLLCNGEVDPNDPLIRQWSGQLASAGALKIGDLARAVGRIQPAGGHAARFAGTGTLVDRDKGLVLTNYHVIHAAESRFGVAMTHLDDHHIRVDGVLEIDFLGEHCSLESNRFRIVEVWLPAGYGEVFDGYDAAVARIEPLDANASLPGTAATLSRYPAYATGAASSLAVIGFPARPSVKDGEHVNWDFVIGTLFAHRFGVKRLAPGLFTRRLGSHPSDKPPGFAIGHDVTTLGGSSGSLLTAWTDQQKPCFALHFGGKTESANYALAFAVAADALEKIGVPFTHA
jgi:serine protease